MNFIRYNAFSELVALLYGEPIFILYKLQVNQINCRLKILPCSFPLLALESKRRIGGAQGKRLAGLGLAGLGLGFTMVGIRSN